MAKYHINNKGEVKPCRANWKQCSFRGETDNANHFDNEKVAEAEAQRRLAKKYGTTTVSKKSSSLDSLRKKGIPVQHVPDVKNAIFEEKSVTPESGSDVVVLSEKPDPLWLQRVRGGEYNAF